MGLVTLLHPIRAITQTTQLTVVATAVVLTMWGLLLASGATVLHGTLVLRMGMTALTRVANG